MASSPEQRISGLKIAGWTLRLLAVIILAALILQGANFFLYLPQGVGYANLAQVASQFVPLIVAIGLLQWGARHLFDQAKEAESTLEEKLAGYVSSNQSTTIETIARWTGVSQKRTADHLARLAARGKLPGFTIDLPSQTVFKTGSDRPMIAPPSGPNTMSVLGAPGVPDDAVRIKAKLYELELLKRQGRISDDEYGEMKGDLERRLVNLDSGTQVY